MPDRTRYALTSSQKAHLAGLYDAGCVNRDTALSALELEHCNPGVVGILIDKGFAAKLSRTTSWGARAQSYWLTAAGIQLARTLRGLA